MACQTSREDDISKVFISVETIPTLTFVPQHLAQLCPITNSYSGQSKESDDSSSFSDSIISIDQAMIEETDCGTKHDMMEPSSEHSDQLLTSLPVVDIVIEDCTIGDEIDSDVDYYSTLITDQLNNNVEVTGKWQQRTMGVSPLDTTTFTDSSTNILLSSIDEERHLLRKPHGFNLHTSNLTSDSSADESGNTLSPNDLDKIKGIARRLNLQTRRASYGTWRSKLVGVFSKEISETHSIDDPAYHKSLVPNESDDEKVSNGIGSTRRISEALSFIKSELMELRRQDESLARQFISIRDGIQQLKLAHTEQEYNDMVEDAQCTLADNEEFESVCDEPRTLDKSPLLTLGITKMNLVERRFSVF